MGGGEARIAESAGQVSAGDGWLRRACTISAVRQVRSLLGFARVSGGVAEIHRDLLHASKLAESSFDAALRYLDGLLEREAEQTRRLVYLLRHAVVLAEAAGQFTRAVGYCQSLVRADASSDGTRVLLARLYGDAGQVDRGRQLCAELRSESVTVEISEMLDAVEVRLGAPES